MIQINILGFHDNRMRFLRMSLMFLTKIKDENKKKIKIVIYTSNNHQYDGWVKFKDEHTDILFEIINVGPDYMSKIDLSIESECKYSCSMDDDIMMSNYVWDYMIENIELLDNDENLVLTPVVSNGIPSCDYFLEDYCTDEERIEIQDIFKNTRTNDYWGVNYASLNAYHQKYWNYNEYYENVSKLNHFYKGIHPVRISIPAHRKISEIICENPERLIKERDFHIQESTFPYLCNSFYFIRTDTWKKIVTNKSLFRDGFDEVPLNIYKEQNNLKFLFVRNGLCLHMAYNTIGNEQQHLQIYYTENLVKKLEEMI